MSINKLSWKTPEIIVLTRNHPEEAVLQACKVKYDSGGCGATGQTERCDYGNSGVGACNYCNYITNT